MIDTTIITVRESKGTEGLTQMSRV